MYYCVLLLEIDKLVLQIWKSFSVLSSHLQVMFYSRVPCIHGNRDRLNSSVISSPNSTTP